MTVDAVVDALTKKPMTYKELFEETGVMSTAVEFAIRTLRTTGEVDFRFVETGRQGKLKQWYLVEDVPESDFKPNAPYEGPSYTHFLQGIWNEQRQTSA